MACRHGAAGGADMQGRSALLYSPPDSATRRRSVMMDVEQVIGTIGAEVCGIDLAGPRPGATVARLREALGEHLVLFFREQKLDIAGLKRLTGVFGELVSVPYVEPMPGERT